MKNINKKTSRKASLLWAEEKGIKSKKKSSGHIKCEGKDFDDVQSLVFLNNPKDRKKLDRIDDRIKLLKAELKSLLGDAVTDKNCKQFVDKNNFSNTLVNVDIKSQENLEADIKPTQNFNNLQITESGEYNQNFNSTPSEFSEWLDKTIDELNSQNEKLNTNKLLSNPKPQIKPTIEIPQPVLIPADFKFGSSRMPSLSQENIERLLYKSFLMPISETSFCLSSSEASDAEKNESFCSTKYSKLRNQSGNQQKCKRGKPVKRTFSPFKKVCKRGVKRRFLNSNISNTSAEVIDLGSISGSDKITERKNAFEDLDVSNYDWSEPFVINEKIKLYSSIEVIEDTRKTNYNNLTSNNFEVTISDKGSCSDKSGKNQIKKAWECPICFERSKGQEIVATQCGHVFCRKCLEDHISKLTNNCPTCRCDLRDKQFITLFNF